MNDLASYSDAFILSQLRYYAGIHGGRDANLVHGLRIQYQQEARRRGLIK